MADEDVQTMSPEDRMMLALAALTYRGFGEHSEKTIHAKLLPWLAKLEGEKLGRWELAWGPATFRVATSLFDDAMIYVARKVADNEPPRYAIAIRGTNPVSVFDWVFGDFWVGLQVDWNPAGDPPAKLSASTALGLAIGNVLAAEDPPSESGVLDSLGKRLISTLAELAQKLPELDPATLLTNPTSFTTVDLKARIDALTAIGERSLRTSAFRRLLDRFTGPPLSPRAALEQSVFDRLLEQVSSVRGDGRTLLAFLNGLAPGAKIAVTGHSKGGALAIATALWLHENWASAHSAEVSCFSFAGPTPGNASFATRYNTALENRTRRIVNARDIVPQAWVPQRLDALREVHKPLGPGLKVLRASVAELGYTHVGGKEIAIRSSEKTKNLVQEIIHQHLDAYLAAAEYEGSEWNAKSIFLGN